MNCGFSGILHNMVLSVQEGHAKIIFYENNYTGTFNTFS